MKIETENDSLTLMYCFKRSRLSSSTVHKNQTEILLDIFIQFI